jgi:hypothetical protein
VRQSRLIFAWDYLTKADLGQRLMNSTVVNKEIRKRIWPVLKENNFTAFTPRTAWRYSDRRIEVINFQSFNSYLAEGVGGTTFSLALNLGTYFTEVPSEFGPNGITSKDGRLCPKEYECHFRRQLQKTLNQPILPRWNIWYVDEDGKNLDAVMEDVLGAILYNGLPWLERFRDNGEVLRTLEHDEETMEGTWGFGAKPSPRRHYMTGYIALALGHQAKAVTHLEQALSSGCYDLVREQIIVAIDSTQAA